MAVAGAVCSDPDAGAWIDAARLDASDVLRQAEHAMRVGAGEIGLEHQLGDFCRVGVGHADRQHRVLDEADAMADAATRADITSRLPAASGTRPLSMVSLSISPHDSALTCRAHSNVPMS